MQKKLGIAVMTALPTRPILVPIAAANDGFRRTSRTLLRSARLAPANPIVIGERKH